MKSLELRKWLDHELTKYHTSAFIETDPIQIPHRFTQKEDIEIAGFFAATFSWGQRVTIINKSTALLERMDNAPYDFIQHHTESDLRVLLGFVHRTFNDTDLLYFVERLRFIYSEGGGLEAAFGAGMTAESQTIEDGLVHFHTSFFSSQHAPKRTQKHIASPARNSTCKRLCMYLRWMVRDGDVDFGLWKSIQSHQLVMPYDVHVERVAKRLGLVQRKQRDWKAVLELTQALKAFDANDPVKYDYALFGSAAIAQ
ncbi:MAG: TIGR02757 family protein [Saprospiraceae bacterium]|nr:TIGR02757 family protein [Saprospiraceae bacterium]